MCMGKWSTRFYRKVYMGITTCATLRIVIARISTMSILMKNILTTLGDGLSPKPPALLLVLAVVAALLISLPSCTREADAPRQDISALATCTTSHAHPATSPPKDELEKYFDVRALFELQTN